MDPVLLARTAAGVSVTHWRRHEGRFSHEEISSAVQSLPALTSFPKKALAKWIDTVLQRFGAEDSHTGQGAKALVRSWARKKNPSFELNPTWDIPRLVAFLEAYREKSGLQPTQPPASDGFEAVPVDFRHFPVFSQSKWIEGHVVVHEPPTTEGAVEAMLASRSSGKDSPSSISDMCSLLSLIQDLDAENTRFRENEEAYSHAIKDVRGDVWAAALEGLKWCQEVHTEVLEWFTTEAQVISDAPSDAAASSDSVTVVDQMKAALTATTASGKSKGEYTGNARARKEGANIVKRDNATALLQAYLECVEKSAVEWGKTLSKCGREAMDQFALIADKLHGLLSEVPETCGDVTTAVAQFVEAFGTKKLSIQESLDKLGESLSTRAASIVDVTSKNCQKSLNVWRDKCGYSHPVAAGSSDDPSSPVVVTVNIDGIVAWLDSKELTKSLKKAEKFSGTDDAIKALTVCKDGLLALTSLCVEAYVTVAQQQEVARSVGPLSAMEQANKEAVSNVSMIFDRFTRAFHQCASWCDAALATMVIDRLAAIAPAEPLVESPVISTPTKGPSSAENASKSSKRKNKAKKTPVSTPVEVLDVDGGEAVATHVLPVIDHVDSSPSEAVTTSVDVETVYMLDNTPTLIQLQQQQLLLEAKDGQLEAANTKIAELEAELANVKADLSKAQLKIGKLTARLTAAQQQSVHQRSVKSGQPTTPSPTKVDIVLRDPPGLDRVAAMPVSTPKKPPTAPKTPQRRTPGYFSVPVSDLAVTVECDGAHSVGRRSAGHSPARSETFQFPTAPQDVAFGFDALAVSSPPPSSQSANRRKPRGGNAVYVPPAKRGPTDTV